MALSPGYNNLQMSQVFQFAESSPKTRATGKTWKSCKKGRAKASANVVTNESEGSPHCGQPHCQEDVPELTDPGAQRHRPLSQRITTVQDNDDELNPFALTLPPLLPHILEGPEDFASPPLTPKQSYPALTPSHCPYADGTMAYRVGDKHKNTKDKNYSMSTGTTSLRHHLIREHLKLWVTACDKLNTLIKGNGMKAAKKFQKATGMTTPIGVSCSDTSSIPEFSRDAFIDAIVKWIIANDRSINIIECPQLR
ncbi:hypothetical protein IW261DRAFT_1565890 [Armillaria novae-zelandiae]|uniref:Uncharacterized protein n=1 Tax=Armillaria novae-zelandiae TaxID=153914 RepID=A0AA39P625_9AGAR|nr:hypothetical protein IW261DRAFT_1565890 [Armillaria novae-zelandiae]